VVLGWVSSPWFVRLNILIDCGNNAVEDSVNYGKRGMGYLSIYTEVAGDLGIRVAIKLCHTGLLASSEPVPHLQSSLFQGIDRPLQQGNLP
jgi:hypothetical protein